MHENCDSFVAPLLQLMDDTSAAIGVSVASALAVLADGSSRIRKILGVEATLQFLVGKLGSLVPGMPWRVAAIVGRLAAGSEELEASLIRAGGLEQLAAVLMSSDVYAQTKGALVLGNVAAGISAHQARVADLACGPRAMKLMQSFNSDVRHAATRLLALTLAEDAVMRKATCTTTGIQLLIGSGENIGGDASRREMGLIGGGGETAAWAAEALHRVLDGGRGERSESARPTIELDGR